jgi:hypothetical protein
MVQKLILNVTGEPDLVLSVEFLVMSCGIGFLNSKLTLKTQNYFG